MTSKHIPEFSHLIKDLLVSLGENPEREGLLETPQRVARSLLELTQGYGLSANDVISNSLFETSSDAMVVQKDTEFYSLCEHHLLPFFGKVHVAYIPTGKIIGLSKLGRVVDVFAKRLQVQEHLTEQITEALWHALKPRALAVVVEAQHFCIMMRGVKKQGGTTQTRSARGEFATNTELRNEAWGLLR